MYHTIFYSIYLYSFTILIIGLYFISFLSVLYHDFPLLYQLINTYLFLTQVDRLDSVSVVKNEIADFISLKEGKRVSACNILLFELSSTCENITRWECETLRYVICAYTYTHTHIQIRIYVCIYICACIHSHVCISIYESCVCLWSNMCIHTWNMYTRKQRHLKISISLSNCHYC